MATLQIRLDDSLKSAVDSLFAALGFDTSTAVRMFLTAALEADGLPFPVKRRKYNAGTLEAMEDSRNRHNLIGPFTSGDEAVRSMLED